MVAMEQERFIPQVPPHAPAVHDGTGAVRQDLRGSVLLLGNFDGLHLGHQALFALAARRSKKTGSPLAILQFDPHPRHYFRGEQGFLISGHTVQRRLLAEAGIDLIYAPVFDARFAGQPAESFVLDHLVTRLGISAVVTGADFRFGQFRAGDVPLLQAMGRICGFSTHVVGECRDRRGEGGRISSSQVRQFIRSGRLDEAERLLGRPFETAIEAGPTGWQFDPMQILPPNGIFMVEARGAAGRRLGRRMLVLKGRRPEARLPAGTLTLLWRAAASIKAAETGFERTDNGL
jgi:riboflavin kinase/FMN adenylyltransferase